MDNQDTIKMMAEIAKKQDRMDAIFRKNLLALRENPVVGNFDLEHLKSIHRRLFSLPPHLEQESTFYAGQFRHGLSKDEVERGTVWEKNRPYPVTRPGEERVRVIYSNMDDEAIGRLDQTLRSIDVLGMTEMNEPEFVDELADLYAKLDFAHPFMDGNSRTLREFTCELAHAVGFDVNWEVFNKDAKSRELLCAARDLGVIDVGFSLAEDGFIQMALAESQYDLKAFKPLNLLMREDGFVEKRSLAAKWESKASSASMGADPFSDVPSTSRSTRASAGASSPTPTDSPSNRRR